MATERELLKIKKDLKARAKKLHLGKARTGAYVYGTLRKIRGNPAPYPDVAMANEMYLFFVNDENLIKRRYPEFVKNLERKVKRGIYDREKAVKLFMYLADEISKQYSKRFGDGKTHAASVPTRMALAKHLLAYYENTRRDPYMRAVGMNSPAPVGYHYMPDGKLMADSAHRNPVRTKTWKLGEYGGNIKAAVNDSKTAVQIIHSDKPLQAGAYGRLFRWPLDKFEVETKLNDLTTSYYASKIIEWIEGVVGEERGDLEEPTGIIRGKNVIRGNPEGVHPIQGGGYVFTREGGGVHRFRVMAIRQGLQARKIGMFTTRGATTKKLLGMLSEYTGEKYGSRDLDRGIADANKLLASDVNMETQRQIARGLTENPSMKHYAVNYLKSDSSRALQTIFVKAKNDEEAVDKAYDLVGGFYHGDAELIPAKRARQIAVRFNPPLAAERLRRQAEILEMDERLVPSTMTYEDIKHDPKLVAHYKKIMTPMAWQNLVRGNPPPLFKSGGYIVVKTYTDGRQEFTDHIDTLEQAREFRKYFLDQNEKSLKYRGRSLFSSVEILPHTAILKNPPLYAHGLRERKGRMWWGKKVTHGLNAGELRALYKLVKKGHWEATRYAQRKLEIPPSDTKSQILAIIDHHIRDLAG